MADPAITAQPPASSKHEDAPSMPSAAATTTPKSNDRTDGRRPKQKPSAQEVRLTQHAQRREHVHQANRSIRAHLAHVLERVAQHPAMTPGHKRALNSARLAITAQEPAQEPAQRQEDQEEDRQEGDAGRFPRSGTRAQQERWMRDWLLQGRRVADHVAALEREHDKDCAQEDDQEDEGDEKDQDRGPRKARAYRLAQSSMADVAKAVVSALHLYGWDWETDIQGIQSIQGSDGFDDARSRPGDADLRRQVCRLFWTVVGMQLMEDNVLAEVPELGHPDVLVAGKGEPLQAAAVTRMRAMPAEVARWLSEEEMPRMGELHTDVMLALRDDQVMLWDQVLEDMEPLVALAKLDDCEVEGQDDADLTDRDDDKDCRLDKEEAAPVEAAIKARAAAGKVPRPTFVVPEKRAGTIASAAKLLDKVRDALVKRRHTLAVGMDAIDRALLPLEGALHGDAKSAAQRVRDAYGSPAQGSLEDGVRRMLERFAPSAREYGALLPGLPVPQQVAVRGAVAPGADGGRGRLLALPATSDSKGPSGSCKGAPAGAKRQRRD